MMFCGEVEDLFLVMKVIGQIKFDFVIVDILLKGYNGIELIKNIKVFDLKIQIFVFFMYDEFIYVMCVFKVGVKVYVMKQEVVDKVMEVVCCI